MDIGILGAVDGRSETRVLVTPRQAGVLAERRVHVYVERGAGARAGFEDADYDAEGATVLSSRADVISRSDVVLSISRPTPAEATGLRKWAILLGMFHLENAGRDLALAATRAGATAVGLERATTDDGHQPFRERMAEVAGVLAMQLAAKLLESGPSRGVLLGGVTGVPPADVVIVGAGALGKAATRAFAGAGATVLVLDSRLSALESVEREGLRRVSTMLAGKSEVSDAASWADVLVGAIRVADGPTPTLLSPYEGKEGAVWLDLSVDEGGCIEGSRPVYAIEDAYKVEGVLCCPVPNLASWAARTASRIGSALLAPALLRAADAGRFDLDAEKWLANAAAR